MDQVLWIYYLAKDLKPVLLDSMPRGDCSVTTSTNNQQLLDAVDDNANVMAPTMLDGDESSQDVLNESCLNGSTFNEDSESASVPYSEEDISQGAASCSVDSTAATIGSDISNVCGGSSVCNISESTLTTCSSPTPIQMNGNTLAAASLSNGNNINNNGCVAISTTTGIIGEDSNLSEDSPSGQLLLANVTSNRMVILTPEENSVDNDVSLDESPPLKKQKTGLELSSALAAAAAETAGAEA